MISWRTPLAVTAAALMLSPGVTHHAHAVSCAAPLAKFGPVNPVHGFPDYYQDSMGLALKPCLDAVCGGGGFALPDPSLPLSFPSNFPVEVFYSRRSAS